MPTAFPRTLNLFKGDHILSVIRTSLRANVAAFALILGAIPGTAYAQRATSLTLPAAPLSQSLNSLSMAAGVEILAAPDLLRGKRAPAVRDASSPEAALRILLKGTGLSFEKRGDAFLIVRGGHPVAANAGRTVPRADAAQTEPRNTAGPVLAAESRDDPENLIVVTGSRIARPELESAMPISVVRMADVERFGRTTAYDALVREPSVGVGIGPGSSYGASWDAGISTVSLRNLGTNRSLTLIDGMRRVSGSAQSSAVDLNMIPGAMIDRIEVVTGGAAAIYGADAVSGAVNVITKTDYQGLQFSAQTGVSGHGDSGRTTISGVGGGKFGDDRGSFIIGATYTKSPELADADRWFARGLHTYLANPDNTGPSDGIPDQILIRNWSGLYISPVPTFYHNGNSYLYRDGQLVIGKYDTQYRTGEFGGGVGGDGYDNNSTRGYMLNEELESFATIARLGYKLNDNIEYTARVDYGQTHALHRSETYRDDSRTVWMGGAGGAVAYLDNPFLPGAIRQYMVDNGLTQLNIDRVYSNFPKKREVHNRQTINLQTGLNGKLFNDLKWGVFFQYGRSQDDVVTRNSPYRSHWIAARDAIADPVTGEAICRDPAARANGCVPFDIFGTTPVTAEQLAYATGTRYEKRINTQRIFGGNLTGRLVSLPYGDASFSLGAEHRTESLVTTDSAGELGTELIGGGLLADHPELDASFDVTEVFGELVVPLLRDLPFVDRLEVEGAYRYSHYNTFGGTNTWKAGATWSPMKGIRFRGVRSRSVRAPNFGELYAPTSEAITGSILDPCGEGRYNNTATRAANCAALGITTPLPAIYSDAVVVTAGGNKNLQPETSDSLTLGAVFQPGFIPGLNLTVDYWNIDIKNVIAQFGYLNILQLCVDLPTTNNSFCPQVVRAADGKVTNVYSNQLNASRMKARGLDFGFDYRRPLVGGKLGVSFKGTYLLERTVQTTPGIAAGDITYDGGYGDPRFRGVLTTSYDIGKLSVALDTRFISATLVYPNNVGDEYVNENEIPSRTYNDLSAQVRVTQRLKVGAGVNNIFDVTPPVYPGTATGAGGRYDTVGRYFFATANLSF